jgi:hypothetical protein
VVFWYGMNQGPGNATIFFKKFMVERGARAYTLREGTGQKKGKWSVHTHSYATRKRNGVVR